MCTMPRCHRLAGQSNETGSAHCGASRKGTCQANTLNIEFMKTFLLSKLGYAFVSNAMPSALMSGAALARANRMVKRHGGLLVGGSIELSPAGVSFTPHAREEPQHVGLRPVNILAANIRSVRREFGWLTGTVVICHLGGEFRFRCFGARSVARLFAKHLQAQFALARPGWRRPGG